MISEKKYHVPALERALDVIDLLASNERDLSFSEILLSLNIPRPSLARILKI
ncbi:MAG: helix-turn-helix domain-containing protein, partial [Desulfobacterales bacterium]|nr:helix-turn-helix domain-containing protein [Desulfobacterales bacterium]